MACEICKKPYIPSTEDSFLDTDKKPHVCYVCGKSFSLKIQLKRHELSHEGNVPYICNACEKHLNQTSTYNLRLSKKGDYACETRNKCFTTKKVLLKHAMEHTFENSLNCDECGESFRNITALKKHAAIHKRKKSVSKSNSRKKGATMPYVCQICGKSFSRSQQLEKHCLLHKKYKCSTCDVCFDSTELLEDHLEFGSCKSKVVNNSSCKDNVSKLNSSNSDDKKHVCGICDQSFTRKSALEGHVISHYAENRESAVEDDSDKDADFQCNYKDDKLSEQSKRVCLPKLKIRRSFPCEQCDLVCATKKSLDKHVISHKTNQEVIEKKIANLNKTYTCRICDVTFDAKEKYKNHKVSHDRKELEQSKEKEQKTYTCQVCLKGFSRKKHLKKHVRNHLDDNDNDNDTNESSSLSSTEFRSGKKQKRIKNFSCSFCGKRFAGETCLRKHEAKHSDDKDDTLSKGRKGKKPKPLICEFCNEDFTGRRHIYLKHKLSHTPEVCGICDARFTDRASLREHCRIHIGTEEGRRFLECSQKALDAKNGNIPQEPKVEYIYLVLR